MKFDIEFFIYFVIVGILGTVLGFVYYCTDMYINNYLIYLGNNEELAGTGNSGPTL